MNIFFDVDQTLLHSSPDDGWFLRPGTAEVIESLNKSGHFVYIWTASGRMHALKLVERYNLGDLVVDCFDKDPVTAPLLPDMIVDDDPFLVEKYSGVLVSQYREVDAGDRELFRVLTYVNGQGSGATG